MKVKIKTIPLIILLLVASSPQARTKQPGWEANLIYLSQYFKLNPDGAVSQFYKCEESRKDCSNMLLFIAKSDIHTAVKLSTNIIKSKEMDFRLRLRAAQILAISGNPQPLLEMLKDQEKQVEDVYALAYAKNYRYSDLILIPFLASDNYCYYTSYITPFLSNDFPQRAAVIEALFSQILGRNKHRHDCALQVIENNKELLSQERLTAINRKIKNLLLSNQVGDYLDFIGRWYARFNQDEALTELIVHYALNNGLENIESLDKNLLVSQPKQIENCSEPIETTGQLKKVNVASGFRPLDDVGFLLKKEFNANWELYFDTISEARLIRLLEKLICNAENFTDRHDKLKFISESKLFHSSYISQVIFCQSLANVFPETVKNTLEKLFEQSNKRQKKELINRFPNQQGWRKSCR